ncbi:MAG TPA: TIGR03435 family protein, partial [Bryobacteraceae bacterium]|nr:TIGR03435 family protein [Bryobacteraceae bacterium]
RIMLQTLLAERFGLRFHRETRPRPSLALIATRHLQLKAANGGESGCRTATGDGGAIITISCENVTTSDFAAQLPRLTGAWLMANPVADMTGLQGGWNFTLRMNSRNWLRAAGSDGISLSAALEKQLGLTLVTRDIPTPVLVVDNVTRKPTPNVPGVDRMLPVLPAKFDVADIKLAAPDNTRRSFQSLPGGLVELRGFSLGDLIRMAWEITDLDAIDHEDLLAGAPAWPERFDIVARAGGSERLNPDSVRTLLRALLEDRFGLRSHFRKQPATVDALIAVKPKLAKADPAVRTSCRNAPAPSGSIWTFTVICRNTTMAQLVEDLPAFGASYIEHPVVDETGLQGGWDFTLSWTPPHLTHAGESAAENDPNGGFTIREALDKELGLKLKTKKRPMDVLVIDRVDRMPTEN